MHHLYTTDAFVLGSAVQGESNRMYRLLTKTHGLLYAHAQSVRELRNRNRFALRTAALVNVTLVRGREMWRITSAREACEFDPGAHTPYRKMLDLIGRLTPVEDPFARTFDIFLANVRTGTKVTREEGVAIELIGIMRILAEHGYIAAKGEGAALVHRLCVDHDDYSPDLLRLVHEERANLLLLTNNALRAARE